MSIITTGAILDLLRPGLDQIISEHDRYERIYDQIYKTFQSLKHEETVVEMKNTGYVFEREQGGQIEIDTIGQRFKYTSVHKSFSLGIEITDQAVRDNLYESEFNDGTRGLMTSQEQTKELMAMAPFNNAFNPNVLEGDGVTLVSGLHPIDGGFYSNQIGVAAGVDGTNIFVDLSETGLEQAVNLAQKLKDQAGLLVAGRITAILVPSESQFKGYRLTESIGRVGTANNDLNAIKGLGLIPKVIPNPYLNGTQWFALTQSEDLRKHYLRDKLEITMTTDAKTKTLSVLSDQRYSFKILPRAILGAAAAA